MSNVPALIQAVRNGNIEVTVKGPSGSGKEAVLLLINNFVASHNDDKLRIATPKCLGRSHDEHRVTIGHADYSKAISIYPCPTYSNTVAGLLNRTARDSSVSVQLRGEGEHHREELIDLNKQLAELFKEAGFFVDRNAMNFTITQVKPSGDNKPAGDQTVRIVTMAETAEDVDRRTYAAALRAQLVALRAQVGALRCYPLNDTFNLKARVIDRQIEALHAELLTVESPEPKSDEWVALPESAHVFRHRDHCFVVYGRPLYPETRMNGNVGYGPIAATPYEDEALALAAKHNPILNHHDAPKPE